MDIPVQRRPSKPRVLERSQSYSNAINDVSVRSSIEIPNIGDTEVYINDEMKGKYKISQKYVEGKEICFPMSDDNTALNSSNDVYLNTNVLSDTVYKDCADYLSHSEDTDDETVKKGLVMKIDIENHSRQSTSQNASSKNSKDYSNASTRRLMRASIPDSELNSIEVEDSFYDNALSTTIPETSTDYTHTFPKRKKRNTHRRRFGAGRPQRTRRVVFKDGEENVPLRTNIPAKSLKYMRDVVNTVINSKWRFMMILMVVCHLLFWVFFASIWFFVTYSYSEDIGDGKEHCVTGTSSFAGMLMMAVETQMTIGYGVRYPNEECPEAIIIMVVEIVMGTALSGGLTSLLFAKLVRPHKHLSSVGFSKKATVCLRDGELCLMFRVWDPMFLHIMGSVVKAYLLKPIRTLEGEFHHNYIHHLKLKEATSFLLWPITVVHVIDSESPLYDLSAQDMMDYRFEIVVVLTGASQSMGTVTESRTSYMSKEIMWGYRFPNVIKYSKKSESYTIDYDNLNTTEQVETPLCSASRLKVFEEDIKSSRNILSMSTSPTDETLNSAHGYNNTYSSANDGSETPIYEEIESQVSGGWAYSKQ